MQTSGEISHELWEIERRLNDMKRHINLAHKEHSKAASNGKPDIKLMLVCKDAVLMGYKELKKHIEGSNNES